MRPDKPPEFHLCQICGNEGVKIFRIKNGDYILRCKFCERKKVIKEDNWQGFAEEVKQFDCDPIKSN